MFRKLTFAIALATAGAVGGQCFAQTAGEGTSAKPSVKLATYGQNYSSAGCVNCGTGGGASTASYAGAAAGYSGGAGPHAMAFGRSWGGAVGSRDLSRFNHYPCVFYPQNFRGNEYYRSSNSMYYRYPKEMQIPVYNRAWHNYYPSSRRYHWGHHFILDVF